MEVLILDIIETVQADLPEAEAHGPCDKSYLQLQADFNLEEIEVCTYEDWEDGLFPNAKLIISKDYRDVACCQLIVKNQKEALSIVMSILKVKQIKGFIHPTANIHPEALIGADVSIGAYSVIGKCSIGNSTRIGAHSIIEADSIIGNNCCIGSHVVIGDPMKVYYQSDKGLNLHMTDIGEVMIGDQVEIGSFSVIGKGCLTKTIVEDFAVIGQHCVIQPGVRIKYQSLVKSQTLIESA